MHQSRGTEQREIREVSVRPQRLAFVLSKAFAFKRIREVIFYNTRTWGGVFNLLVPTDGHSLSRAWMQALVTHDPDILIFCGRTTKSLRKELCDVTQPFKFFDWRIIEQGLAQRHDPLESVHVLETFAEEIRDLRSSEGSTVRIPSLRRSDPLHRFAVAQFGELDERHRKVYENDLKAQVLEFDPPNDITSYTSFLLRLSKYWTPIELTRHELNSTWYFDSGLGGGLVVVLAGGDYLEDLCVFWMLRMLSSSPIGPRRQGIVFLPTRDLRAENGVRALAEWCNGMQPKSTYITLASSSVSKGALVRLRDRLKPLLSQPVTCVDVCSSGFSVGRFDLKHLSTKEEIDWRDARSVIKVPKLSFHGWRGHLVVEMRPSHSRTAAASFLPPRFAGLNQFLEEALDRRALWKYSIRRSGTSLARHIGERSELVDFPQLRAEHLFEKICASSGYAARRTEKASYYHRTMHLLEGAGGCGFLRSAHYRQIVGFMSQESRATFRQMASIVQDHTLHGEIKSWLKRCAGAGVIHRGCVLRCEACGIEDWYSIDEVREMVVCHGCFTEFQTPLRVEFSYRLNTLVSRGIEQGAISAILTDMLLRDGTRHSYMSVLGMEVDVARPKPIDIDLIAACDGHLVAAEFKTLEKGLSEKTERRILQQLTRIYQVCRELRAGLLLVSAMRKRVPKQFIQRVKRLEKSYGPKLHFALVDDLERGYIEPQQLRAGSGRQLYIEDMVITRPIQPRILSDKGEHKMWY